MTVPKEVPLDKVVELLEGLGLKPKDLKQLTMTPKEIIAEVSVRGPEGKIKLDGHRAMTVLEKIRVVA